jgi:plasmid stability protein
MRSITIHNLDPDVSRLIDKQAAEEGLSLNQLVKRLLRKALALPGQAPAPSRGFDDFSGLWTKEEAAEFNVSVKREIDPEDWK